MSGARTVRGNTAVRTGWGSVRVIEKSSNGSFDWEASSSGENDRVSVSVCEDGIDIGR